MASSSSSQQQQQQEEERSQGDRQQQPPQPSFDSFLSLSLRPYSGTRVDVGPHFGTSWARSAPRLKIVALGDSITQMAAFSDGWLSLLAARYQRRADVFNRGYSGYSTRNALPVVRQQVADGHWPYSPAASSSSPSSPSFSQLLIIGLGTNDAVWPPEAIGPTPPAVAQHVPVAAFTANLKKLIALLVPEYSAVPAEAQLPQYASGSTAVVLLTPAQLDEPAFRAHVAKESGLPPVQSRSLEATLPYVEAVRAIGRQWRLPVCDCWEMSQPGSSGQWAVFSDGLHLSPAGNARLYEALLRVIETQYPSLRVEVLPMDAPAFEVWDYSGDVKEEQTWPAGSLD